jgi:hypothetical protein
MSSIRSVIPNYFNVGRTVQFSRSGERRRPGLGRRSLKTQQHDDKTTGQGGLADPDSVDVLVAARARRRGMRRRQEQPLQSWSFPRKEVIQPHLPVRLPCYDFTPVTGPTFDGSLPKGLGHRLRVLPASVV